MTTLDGGDDGGSFFLTSSGAAPAEPDPDMQEATLLSTQEVRRRVLLAQALRMRHGSSALPTVLPMICRSPHAI